MYLSEVLLYVSFFKTLNKTLLLLSMIYDSTMFVLLEYKMLKADL